MSLLQTCSPASMGVSVCTQLSVTADASMPVDLVASWVGLISATPGGTTGAEKLLVQDQEVVLCLRNGTALPDLEPISLQHCPHTNLGSLCSVAVYNTGPERDSICRAWGQHHVETFDGLYYYLSGKGSYMLVGHHELEGQSFSIQVRSPLSCPAGPRRRHQALGTVEAGACLSSRGWWFPFIPLSSSCSRSVSLEGATVSKALLTPSPQAAPACLWPFAHLGRLPWHILYSVPEYRVS